MAYFYSVFFLTFQYFSDSIRVTINIIHSQEENKMNTVPKYMSNVITVIQCVTAATVLALFASLLF